MTDFLNHAGAADGSQFGAWNPATAADRTIRLAAAGAGAVVASRRCAGLWANRARDLLGFGDPITRADFDLSGFGHWLADGVTDIAVAGFGFRLVGGAADFAALGFVNRLTDRTADVAVAGLEARLTDRTADIAITGLVARLADGVALIAIARFGDVAGAGDRNLLRALFIDSTAAVIGLLFPDGFTNRLVTGTAASLGGAVGTAGRTGCGRAAFRAGCSAVERFDS